MANIAAALERIKEMASMVSALDLENRRLRAFIAKSDLPCLYCGISKDDYCGSDKYTLGALEFGHRSSCPVLLAQSILYEKE